MPFFRFNSSKIIWKWGRNILTETAAVKQPNFDGEENCMVNGFIRNGKDKNDTIFPVLRAFSQKITLYCIKVQ